MKKPIFKIEGKEKLQRIEKFCDKMREKKIDFSSELFVKNGSLMIKFYICGKL